VYVPLGLQQPASGSGNVFVRLETRLEVSGRVGRFGSIQINSGQVGGELFLDGGSVGMIDTNDTLSLEYVLPGVRKVTLKPEGKPELDELAIVQEARTSVVAFENAAQNAETAKPFQLLAQGENDKGFKEYLRPIDDALMIEIPEGEFLMGNERTERTPFEHMVNLSTFLIDKTAVTWKQFKEFLADTSRPLPPHDPYWGIHDDHPAVYVTWAESRSYCQWAGGRLPTEAEREKAARGTDERLYPWGEEAPTPDRGVFRRAWGDLATDPVGIRPLGASPYGALDMGGNVWEWCLDWYSDEYLEQSPYENPAGPESGLLYVLRGGSWDSRPDVLSASCRNFGHPGYREGDFGFRCAMSAPPD
jgi:formylglycine-generating enzyme required for sulfatase activity